MSRQVRDLLEPLVAGGIAPGMVALVGRGDHADVEAVGRMAFGSDTPMAADAIFRISSMTKPITAAATLMLIEDGRLELEEPVDRLLPELANRRVLRTPASPLDDTVPAARPITVEDLLTFRMGLGIVFGSPEQFPILAAIRARDLAGFGPPRPDWGYGPDEWLRRLAELPLMAQPGERWLYSAPSNVLGVLIARASGQSLPAFLERRVFAPLGMRDTAFFVPPTKRPRLTAAYWNAPDGLNTGDYTRPPSFPEGDAGLVSTAADVFAFSRFMLRRGATSDGARLLSETSIVAMTRDQLTPQQRRGGAPILSEGEGWGYGLSVRLQRSDAGVPTGAFGWNGGLGTSWVMDPETDRVAVLLTQAAFTSPEAGAVHASLQRVAFER
ncbi:MAG TPA: serine hydrolase domain-containing protein [Caulobacteraceae bacterium]|jgi:CubicO group peptidase (beta-lactamase class C family)|nr:serine hydrolase domain-containing protein [Caulobacteraceae bacterium]